MHSKGSMARPSQRCVRPQRHVGSYHGYVAFQMPAGRESQSSRAHSFVLSALPPCAMSELARRHQRVVFQTHHADPGDEILKECATLFSDHYGVWGPTAPRQGRVKCSASLLRSQHLFRDSCFLVTARLRSNQMLVGHAFATTFMLPSNRKVVWLTQLVVHSDHRGDEVGKFLCGYVFPPDPRRFASGLVTSHPYAIRSLESSTGRNCDADRIRQEAPLLLERCGIPYMARCSRLDEHSVTVNTNFHVDHTEIKKLLEPTAGHHPVLGSIADGFEFFAFTFKDQPINYESIRKLQLPAALHLRRYFHRGWTFDRYRQLKFELLSREVKRMAKWRLDQRCPQKIRQQQLRRNRQMIRRRKNQRNRFFVRSRLR